MTEVRFLPQAAKYIRKLKDKKLKALFQKAVDRIREDSAVGKAKTVYEIFVKNRNRQAEILRLRFLRLLGVHLGGAVYFLRRSLVRSYSI